MIPPHARQTTTDRAETFGAAFEGTVRRATTLPESINEARWDKRGSELDVVYHGSKEFIKAVDPSRLQGRDYGYYGRGFYVASTISGAKAYGGRISTFRVDPSATVLWADVFKRVDPQLVDALIDHKYNKHIDRVRQRGKEEGFLAELELIRTSHLALKDAVDEYARDKDYDIVYYGPGEIVVKDTNVLTRIPTQHRGAVQEVDFRSYNLWDKLDMDTREALALAAGFTKEFAVRAWADITKRERRALKRIWDPAVGEQVK